MYSLAYSFIPHYRRSFFVKKLRYIILLMLVMMPSAYGSGDYYSLKLEALLRGEEHRFAALTPSGQEIFHKMREYISTQKQDNFRPYFQPSFCVWNVAHVLFGQDMTTPYHAGIHNVYELTSRLVEEGALHIKLPALVTEVRSGPDLEETYKRRLQDIAEVWETHFKHGIPVGTVVLGILPSSNSKGMKKLGWSASAHSGIVGDQDIYGTQMLYHTNWLRGESVSRSRIKDTVRFPFMVSLDNMYHRKLPREWTTTPWLHIVQGDDGKVTEIKTPVVSAFVDDLDISNPKYDISLLVPGSVYQEYLALDFSQGGSGVDYIRNDLLLEGGKEVCLIKKPDVCPRKKDPRCETLKQEDGSHLIYVSNSSRYGTAEGSYWDILEPEHAICQTVKQWKCLYYQSTSKLRTIHHFDDAVAQICS